MKAFCEECRDDVEYQVFVEQTTTNVNGKLYQKVNEQNGHKGLD